MRSRQLLLWVPAILTLAIMSSCLFPDPGYWGRGRSEGGRHSEHGRGHDRGRDRDRDSHEERH